MLTAASTHPLGPVDQSSQRPGNIEQIQALRYTREFLEKLIDGECPTQSAAERLYSNVSNALGLPGEANASR
jgi:hypothetical protein